MDEQCHNLPVNNFEWIEETSQFNEDFIKTVMKKLMKNIFLKLMFITQKKYMNFIITYLFCRKERNLKKSKSFSLVYMIKMNVIHILKQALNNGLILKKVHRVIKFNQKD